MEFTKEELVWIALGLRLRTNELSSEARFAKSDGMRGTMLQNACDVHKLACRINDYLTKLDS